MNKVIVDTKDILNVIGAEEYFSFEKDFSPIKVDADQIEFAEPVKFDINLENIGTGIRVSGHIKSALKLTCGRCLTEFSFPVDWHIDELFYKENMPKEEEAYEMKNGIIDLGPPTEEEFVLAIPMKPLCDESCRGICAICGEVITAKHKPHGEVKIDARLAVLKKLLEEKRKE